MLRKPRIWLLAVIGVIAIGGVGVACGEDGEGDETPTAAATSAATGTAPAGTPSALSGELEVFSWWTTGGEAAGLEALFDLYPDQCSPDVEITNATVAGGGGAQARQVLTTRMLGNDPPGSFQVHMGKELTDTWVTTDYMEPLDALFAEEGWEDVFPQGVLDIVSYEGKPYSVPVNIHRANVLWYNKKVFADNNLEPPATFEEFFTVAEALKANGITPLALGDVEAFASVQLMETTLIGVLGADAYNGLWTGETDWSGAEVTSALDTFKRLLGYVNSDHSSLTWDQANDLVISGDAAMTVMGDWLHADNKAKDFADSGWMPSPGTAGIYDALSDTFGLPKNAPNPDAVNCWLKLVGSKAGQEAFNPLKGSICARTDCDAALFDEYLNSATDDWKQDAIVPSLAHGAAAAPGWATEISDAVTVFLVDQSVGTLQSRLSDACQGADVCQ
ncbi:MAG TPA: ABC transporter substrate-binding protein [Dehalococcoidia bacterium]|nr:ABC transporter substrate-binding protein [Dehalococcoidia bacterium]